MTSALFGRYAAESYAAQDKQNRIVAAAGVASPTIALRSLSMAAAGTDFASHRRFLDQAEAYRYALVQTLNRLQAEGVRYADDIASDAGADQRKRVAAANWDEIPDFAYRSPAGGALALAALPGLAIIAAWLAIAGLLLRRTTRKLGAN